MSATPTRLPSHPTKLLGINLLTAGQGSLVFTRRKIFIITSLEKSKKTSRALKTGHKDLVFGYKRHVESSFFPLLCLTISWSNGDYAIRPPVRPDLCLSSPCKVLSPADVKEIK